MFPTSYLLSIEPNALQLYKIPLLIDDLIITKKQVLLCMTYVQLMFTTATEANLINILRS